MSPTFETLPQLLRQVSAAAADRTALITDTERVTYRQLADLTESYARGLVGCGVGKGSRIGLLMENSVEWVAFAFAATGLGAILVPISTFARPAEIEYQLRHADVAQLFMSGRFLRTDYVALMDALLSGAEAADDRRIYSDRFPALRRVVVKDDGDRPVPAAFFTWNEFMASADRVPPSVVRALADDVDPEDECYLLYTSGTTANPKGVLHRHKSIVRNGVLIGRYQMLEPDDVVWFYFPFFFCAGCVNVLLGTLSSHASLIVQPEFDPERAISLIERERATTWHVWPHQVKALMSHPDWLKKDHSLLHKGTGAYDLMLKVGDRFGGVGGVGMYGMTETCTAFTCTHADESAQVRSRTCGRPMTGNEMKIVDAQTGRAVDAGQTGEICVKGPSVLRRYYKVDPELTFDDQGYLRTGDLGYVDESGRLHFLQRMKDMIKSGGINISPTDIEGTLGGLEGVQEAFAFPLPGGDRGELVGAAIVAEAKPTADRVRKHCADEFSSHKRPVAVLMLARRDLPMTGSGKVQKVKLADMLMEDCAGGPDRCVVVSPDGIAQALAGRDS